MYVATSEFEALHVMDAARALASIHEHVPVPILVVADAELKAVYQGIERRQ